MATPSSALQRPLSSTRQGAFVADAEADAQFQARRNRLMWRRRLLPLAAAILLLALWQFVVVYFGIRSFIAPSPLAVAYTLIDRFGILMQNLLPTAIEALLGFCLGNLAAIALATVFVHNKTVEEAFFPIVVLINTIPVVAKAPILVLLMGNGIEPKIAIAALICFFPTLVNMTRGLSAVNPQTLELMRVLSASDREIFWKLRVYNSLPYLFSALKIAASTSVIGAIVAEWIGTTVGIGALIIEATYKFDSPMLYATVIVGASFSVTFFFVITLIERLVVKWESQAVH